MSDEERADRFVLAWMPARVDTPAGRTLRALLVEAFAAVRRDERRAIVAWLRFGKSVSGPATAFADVIERGEYQKENNQ